jgi:hypothetical protein
MDRTNPSASALVAAHSGCYASDMTARNPFPGMNPFFELRWRDAHARLITYISDALQEILPADLVAAAEEEVVAVGADQPSRSFRPDIQVRQPWSAPESGGVAVAAEPLAATEPLYIFTDDAVERWVEILDENGRLITVLELLSPTNKREAWQRERYASKRHGLISGGVNLVEIDLVRQGSSVFPETCREVLLRYRAPYGVSVFRATASQKAELYPIRLRDRLPVIRVPLRAADSDVPLDLQRLIDQCHERGRYHLLDYDAPLDPPLDADDRAWARELLDKNFG